MSGQACIDPDPVEIFTDNISVIFSYFSNHALYPLKTCKLTPFGFCIPSNCNHINKIKIVFYGLEMWDFVKKCVSDSLKKGSKKMPLQMTM